MSLGGSPFYNNSAACCFRAMARLDASCCNGELSIRSVVFPTFWIRLSRIVYTAGRDCCKLLLTMPKLGSGRILKNDSLMYQRQAALCKALAHPSRIQLLDLVGKGERACADLQKQLGVS